MNLLTLPLALVSPKTSFLERNEVCQVLSSKLLFNSNKSLYTSITDSFFHIALIRLKNKVSVKKAVNKKSQGGTRRGKSFIFFVSAYNQSIYFDNPVYLYHQALPKCLASMSTIFNLPQNLAEEPRFSKNKINIYLTALLLYP